MNKMSVIARSVLVSLFLSTTSLAATALSNTDISTALKQALTIGTQNVATKLGKSGGFTLDPKVHIPLPPTLQKVDKALTYVGMGNLTDDLELRINQAAEASMPKAKTLFLDAIKQMTISDAKTILNGPNNAGTLYLKDKMSPQLAIEMRPIVQNALDQSGAIKSYNQVMGQYSKLPLASGVTGNLVNYAIDKTISGMFYYVGQEEAAIRANPAKQTTSLLKTVFSGLTK